MQAQLESQPGSLTGGIASLMSSNVLGALLAVVLSALIGRVTGETGLGVYMASVAWVFPLALLVDAGIGTLLTRDLVNPNAPTSRAYLNAALVARLVLGLPVMVALIVAAPILGGSPQVTLGIAISAPLVVIIPMVSTFTAMFRARRTMRYAAALNVGMLSAQVIFTSLIFASGGDVIAALWVNLLTSCGQLAVAYALWAARLAEPSAGEPVDWRSMLRRALPFAAAAVIAAVQMRINIILLERVVSVEQAGTYAAASRFIEAGRLIPQAAFDAMLPFLALFVTTPERFTNAFRMARWGLFGYGIIFGAGVWLLAYVLIGIVFGPEFDASAEVLRVLAWSLLPMSLKYLRGIYWYARGREDWVITVSLLALIGQSIAAFTVLPVYGAIGAAWVALISEAAAAGALWFFKPREHEIEIL